MPHLQRCSSPESATAVHHKTRENHESAHKSCFQISILYIYIYTHYTYIYTHYNIYIYIMARWLLWLSSGRFKKDSKGCPFLPSSNRTSSCNNHTIQAIQTISNLPQVYKRLGSSCSHGLPHRSSQGHIQMAYPLVN